MKVRGLLIGVAALLVAATSFAGYRSWSQVSVYTSGAYGSIAGAYFASDSTQYIGCTTNASSAGGGVFGQCFARNSAGTYRTCSTSNPAMVSVIQTVGPSSYVYFTVAADNYGCTFIGINNDSTTAAY